MTDMEHVLKMMTFEFFGEGRHKINMEKLFEIDNAVLLDVRSHQEVESIQLKFEHHIDVMHIPTNEIPDRVIEIPRDKYVGVFCSAGTRSAIVYAFLRTKGYENVYIVLGGYEEAASLVLPSKLLKHIKMKNTGQE